MKKIVVYALTSLLLLLPTFVLAEDVVNTVMRLPKPYVLTAGTYIEVVLINANEVVPVGQVSTPVYDRFNNIAIPQGSKIVGRYLGISASRHIIQWTEMQLPNGRSIILPAIQGADPDGSAGISHYESGAQTLITLPDDLPLAN